MRRSTSLGAFGQCGAIAALALLIGAGDRAVRPLTLSLPAPSAPDPVPAPVSNPAPVSAPAAATTASPQGAISLDQLQALMSSSPVQFVDARSRAEFDAGRITGAVLLSPDMFSGQTPAQALALDRSLPIVVYCTGGSCESSVLVALRLREMGFSQLHVYEEGFAGWKAAGLPVEQPGAGGGK
jgi:rhodanese-related sulfurtransferase